jgi:hypothetical protein
MQVFLVSFATPYAAPLQLTVGNQGSTASPKLSPDGSRAMWLQQQMDGYEADRNRLVVYEIDENVTGEKRWGATEGWDRSPFSISWKDDSKGAWLISEVSRVTSNDPSYYH